MNINKISTALGILTTLIAAGFWVYSYHKTLSTKADVNLIYIELRIRDVEDSIFYYSQQKELSEYGKIRFNKAKETMTRLEAERDKILGLAK